MTWLVRRRLTLAALRERGMSALDKGREQAQLNAEATWRRFCATHLPHLDATPAPGSGQQSAA